MSRRFRDGSRHIYVPDEPITDTEWAKRVVEARRRHEWERCNYYRPGYGTCCLVRDHGRHSHSYIRIPPNPTTRQDTDMTRSAATIAQELRTIEAEEERLFQRKVALQTEAERLASRPEAPPDGSVIVFKVQYDEDGPVYKHAAIRFGNDWFITSSRQQGAFTWHGILDMIERDVSVASGARKPEFYVDVTWKLRRW